MTITIRRATRDDAETIVGLIRQLAKSQNIENSSKSYGSDVRLLLQNTDISRQGEGRVWDHRFLHAWLAESTDDSAVGYAMGFYGGFSSFALNWDFCLIDLFVVPSVRRTGVGQRFLQYIADEVFEHADALLFEILEWNNEAVAFCAHSGGRYVGQRIQSNGQVWVQMKIEDED